MDIKILQNSYFDTLQEMDKLESLVAVQREFPDVTTKHFRKNSNQIKLYEIEKKLTRLKLLIDVQLLTENVKK